MRWEAWLLAPCSGTFTFETISDDGAALWINKNPLLTHNWSSVGKPGADWMEAMHAEPDALSPTKKSKTIEMDGGSKYLLKMEVFHSVHNEVDTNMASYAKLKWESDQFPP